MRANAIRNSLTILALAGAALLPRMAMAQQTQQPPTGQPETVAQVRMPQPAQTPPPPPVKIGDQWAIGEKYFFEFSYTYWQPSLAGNIASDNLGLVGSTVDFNSDLALERSRFDDFRFVLRPAKQHRIKFQYTPVTFAGSGTLSRDITFAGQVYPVSLPVESTLSWKVLRIGYEWDFFYRPRGFVGVLVTGGYTKLDASIASIVGSGTATGSSPLIEIGAAGRFYPTRHLAINVEGSGLKLTNLEPDSLLKTMSWDLSATYNITNNFGVSGGWRRLDTQVKVKGDSGELDFKGLWFGGSIRY